MATLGDIKVTIFNFPDISFKEKEDLAWVFSDASDEELAAAEKLFAEDKTWIKRLSDNYQKKRLAFLTDDVHLWKTILKEEAGYAAA